MIQAIWVDEKALFDLGRGMVIEHLVRQLENVAIGVPEYLVPQLPPLKCHKYVVSSEEELHNMIRTYFEREEIVSVPCNRVITKSGSVDINSAEDLKLARKWVKEEEPKVCYVGQRLYFGKQVSRDATWLELAVGLDCNWNVLLDVDADLFVFFMPHHLPPNIKRRIKHKMVGVHAEPLPKFIKGEYKSSKDLVQRMIDMTVAFDFEHLYHHDKTSFPILEREGVHVEEFISAIDTETYYPQDLPKKWDLIFYGRETQHRLDMMLPAKHQFGGRFLHMVHGIDGNELNRMQGMSVIGVNCHTEDIPALENRMQVLMASGLFVLSEPLSHNDCFAPGLHFIEFKDANDLIWKAKYYLEHKEEREKIAQAGHEFVVKNLAAERKWPQLAAEVLI